jgi:tRNA-dihydrouridine synthase 3
MQETPPSAEVSSGIPNPTTAAESEADEQELAVVPEVSTTSNSVRGLPPEEKVARGWLAIRDEFIQPPSARGYKRPREQETDAAPTQQQQQQQQQPTGPTSKRARKKALKNAEASQLCPQLVEGGGPERCRHGASCKFSHDLQAVLAQRPPDLPGVCPVFARHGHCPSGLRCRWIGSHLHEGPTNARDEELAARCPLLEVANNLGKELQRRLERREVKYPRAAAALAHVRKLDKASPAPPSDSPASCPAPADQPQPQPRAQAQARTCAEAQEAMDQAEASAQPAAEAAAAAAAAAAVDRARTGRAERESEFVEARSSAEERRALARRVDFRGKRVLAPLTTLGNVPFRQVCVSLGAEVTVGEMALCTNLLRGHRSEWALLRRHPSERVFGVQVAAAHADQLAQVCELVEEQGLSFDFVDLNCGCPIDSVAGRGMGAALVERPSRLRQLCLAASATLREHPLTLKTRIGRDENAPTLARQILPHLREWGVAAVTVHGRSRLQRYLRDANWSYLAECRAVLPPELQLIGNGDAYTWRQVEACLQLSGADACMVARGALIKPWIFTELRDRRDWDISAQERLDIIREYVHAGLD